MEKGNFDGLVNQIKSTTAILCEDAKSVINRNVTVRAWLTGFYIVEYEQHGNDRAKYGEGLLKALAKRLDSDKFSYPSLKIYRQFYLAYPELSHSVAEYLIGRFGKGSTVSSLLTEASTSPMLLKGSTASSLSISPRNVEKCDEILKIDPVVLFTRLSFSHISELLHLSDALQRTFYAIEAIRGTWSVRELRRQIEPDDNPPVGIMLCTEVGQEMAEYVSTFIDPSLFISKYELELPPKERIVEFLQKENKE